MSRAALLSPPAGQPSPSAEPQFTFEVESVRLQDGDPIHHCRLWILVVGVEFSVDDGRKSPTALLTLCSNERSVEVAAWNGRLELQSPPDRRWLHYRAVDGSIRKFALGNVVAMKRRLP